MENTSQDKITLSERTCLELFIQKEKRVDYTYVHRYMTHSRLYVPTKYVINPSYTSEYSAHTKLPHP